MRVLISGAAGHPGRRGARKPLEVGLELSAVERDVVWRLDGGSVVDGRRGAAARDAGTIRRGAVRRITAAGGVSVVADRMVSGGRWT